MRAWTRPRVLVSAPHPPAADRARGLAHDARRIIAVARLSRAGGTRPATDFPFDVDADTVRWAVELAHAPDIGPVGAVVGLVQAYEGDDPDYDEAGIDMSSRRRCTGGASARRWSRWCVTGSSSDRGHHLVTIDPAASNAGAIACYRACGFQPVGVLHGRERNTDGTGWHDTLLMAYSSVV